MNKSYYKFLTAMLALPLFLASCIKDGTETGAPGNDDPLITFSIKVPGNSTPSTRAISTADESAVESMDILLFDVASNGGGYGFHAATGPVTIGSNNQGTFTVKLPAGTYDMVMIANAGTEVAAAVAGLTPISTKYDLQQALTFTRTGKWPATTGSHDAIPMWAEVTGATISGGTSISGVNLTRALAKINVEVEASNFKLTEVHLYHPMRQGHIIPLESNMSGTPPKATAPSLDPAWRRGTGSQIYTATAFELTDTECKNEIYTFEAPAGDGTASPGTNMTDGNTFLVIGGEYGNDGVTTYYRVDFVSRSVYGNITNLDLLRNHRYEVIVRALKDSGTATASQAASAGPVNITAEVVVRNEHEMHYYLYDDKYFFGLEDREITVAPEGGTFSFNVVTDNPGGWTAAVSTDPDNPTAGLPSWLNAAPLTGSRGTTAVNYSTQSNSIADRTAYIHFTAGDLKAVVKFTQKFVFDFEKVNPAPFTYGYVGAFWRADQTGERLIRITRSANGTSIEGDWSATVVEGEDWIKLDTRPSDDPGIEWKPTPVGTPADMLNASNDAKYQVTGTATRVTGSCNADPTGEIYFRIGLRSTIGPTQNRYGLILLTYGGNNYKQTLIFVRQGHAADYIMRPEDNNATGTLHTMTNGTGGVGGGTAATPRPQAAKFSPYNLTTTQFNSGSTASSFQLPVRSTLVPGGGGTGGGVFTDFPSQSGALFKFADGSGQERLAYNPIFGTDINGSFSASFWSVLASTHETCPPGYRRSSDGVTSETNATGPIANSEVRQSLFLNPFPGITGMDYNAAGNVILGYYADGYFDRYAIQTSSDNYSQSAVNVTDSRVAYKGVLWYNPTNYAAIFMPASGRLYEAPSGYYRRGGDDMVLDGW